MRIYLVRHGKAADEGYRYDEDRPLTDEGRALMRATARAWAAHSAERAPELWVTSPLVRAVQTCEICVDVFGSDGPVEVSRALVPEGPVSAVADLLGRKALPGRVALVGHEPLISEIAGLVLGRRWPEGFRKGAVLAAKRAAGADEAKLSWYLEPARGDKPPRFRDSV